MCVFCLPCRRGVHGCVFSIKLLSSSFEGGARVFRLLEVIKIPPIDGNVQVLVFRHPGDNALGQYMSVSERRSSFLPGSEAERERASREGSSNELQTMDRIPEAPPQSQSASEPGSRSIDVSSSHSIPVPVLINPALFVSPVSRTCFTPCGGISSLTSSFALQAVQCLEMLHANYGAHGDVRPCTFHWSESDDLVRIAHFGGRNM
jgi:hypothetical protein